MCIAPSRRPNPTNLAVKPELAASASSNKRALLLGAAASACPKPSMQKYSRPMKHHITVQHNYHDHATDICYDSRRAPARGGVVTPFPLKLHAMLEAVAKDKLESIVSWQPHGRCFAVHDQKKFVDILIKHFNISKVSSFQRQLNLYGFQRITKGLDKGGYYNELFLRNKVFLSHNIHRVKVKGTKIRARSNPAQEPNFYDMPWVVASEQKPQQPVPTSAPAAPQFSELDALVDISVDDLSDILLGEQPMACIPHSMWDDEDDEFIADADSFLKDIDLPSDDNAFDNIEDDDVFGQLLEQMIA